MYRLEKDGAKVYSLNIVSKRMEVTSLAATLRILIVLPQALRNFGSASAIFTDFTD